MRRLHIVDSSRSVTPRTTNTYVDYYTRLYGPLPKRTREPSVPDGFPCGDKPRYSDFYDDDDKEGSSRNSHD